MSMTREDQQIYFRFRALLLYPVWESAAHRSAWSDAELMARIERRKHDTRLELRRLQVEGR